MPTPIRQRRTAGFSFASRPIYVSFTGNKVPFNVDTIRAIESLWMDIKTSDGEGSVAPKVRDVSYSSPLTYGQEKTGDVREAVARIDVPEGYEAKYFASIRKNITGFDITLLPEYRKAETQKGTPSRGRTKRLPLGLGLRSSKTVVGYDKSAAVSTLQSMLNAASRAGAAAKAQGATDKVKAFKTFANGGNGGRKDLLKSLGEPYASQVKEAFFAAFDGGKTGASKAAYGDDALMRAIRYCGTGSLQYHKTREGSGYCDSMAWDSKNVVSTGTVDTLFRRGLMEGYPSPASKQYVHLTQAGKDALAAGALPAKQASSDRFPDESKLPKGKIVVDNLTLEGMPSFLYKAWEPRNGRPYFLVKGFGPYTQMGAWLTEAQAEPFLKKASSRKASYDSPLGMTMTQMERYLMGIFNNYPEYSDPNSDGNPPAVAFMDMVEKFAGDPFYKGHEIAKEFLKGAKNWPDTYQSRQASKKTAGMGKSEYLRRLRDLKAKLNHLMSDAAVSGTAPKNLRKAEASLEAEITEVKGVKTEEAPEAPVATSKKTK